MFKPKNKSKEDEKRKEQNEYERELEKSMRDGNFSKIILFI